MNKLCHSCNNFDQNSVEYEEFLATHKCRSNFSGSAGLMEPIGVQRIYARSMVSRKLRYTIYIGDGDTKSYSSVVKEQPYGPNTQIEKLECAGHVQKRLGNAIKRLKQQKGRMHLKDGKTIGGKGN